MLVVETCTASVRRAKRATRRIYMMLKCVNVLFVTLYHFLSPSLLTFFPVVVVGCLVDEGGGKGGGKGKHKRRSSSSIPRANLRKKRANWAPLIPARTQPTYSLQSSIFPVQIPLI